MTLDGNLGGKWIWSSFGFTAACLPRFVLYYSWSVYVYDVLYEAFLSTIAELLDQQTGFSINEEYSPNREIWIEVEVISPLCTKKKIHFFFKKNLIVYRIYYYVLYSYLL
jgi:hypothetical protein